MNRTERLNLLKRRKWQVYRSDCQSVITLNWCTLEGIQSVYVEEMNIFFAKSTLDDPMLICRVELNVIQLFGLDQFLLINNEDSVHWELFRKVQAKLTNRNTGLFEFQSRSITYTDALDYDKETKTDNNLISCSFSNV